MRGILDQRTLETLLTPSELSAVAETLRAGSWWGLPVPGDPAWALTVDEGPCDRLLALGIHYFTSRYPAAEPALYAIAAQVLHELATGWAAGYPVESDPRYQRAWAWLFALAGGYPAPPEAEGRIAFTLPLHPETHEPDVPGGSVAFTRCAVEVLGRLLFESEASAQGLAEEYLAEHAANPLAVRAATIFRQVQRWPAQNASAASVRCFDCGAGKLDHWYTSARGGYHLSPACFEARAAKGRARLADTAGPGDGDTAPA
ncbi:MAG: hypothetical protein AB1555_07010 [Nitrospirota bacterium]